MLYQEGALRTNMKDKLMRINANTNTDVKDARTFMLILISLPFIFP